MKRIDAWHSLTFSKNHVKMIGDKEFTIDEAFKIYMSFLRGFGYYKQFLYGLRKFFGNSYQMYRQFFKIWITSLVKHENRSYHYFWTNDRVILLPFWPHPEVNDAFYNNSKVYKEIREFLECWRLYCEENKLVFSKIKLDEEDEYTDYRGYTWEDILEECGYPTHERD